MVHTSNQSIKQLKPHAMQCKNHNIFQGCSSNPNFLLCMKIICMYIYTQDLIFFSHEQMFTDQIDTGTASHIYTIHKLLKHIISLYRLQFRNLEWNPKAIEGT